MKIPKSWIHFKEIEGGDDIQYCDGTDVNIVTLNTFKPEQFSLVLVKVSTLHLKLFKFQLAFMNLNRKVKTSPRYGGQNQLSEAMRPT